jgi:hypothetical protein
MGRIEYLSILPGERGKYMAGGVEKIVGRHGILSGPTILRKPYGMLLFASAMVLNKV